MCQIDERSFLTGMKCPKSSPKWAGYRTVDTYDPPKKNDHVFCSHGTVKFPLCSHGTMNQVEFNFFTFSTPELMIRA